jgi:nitrogen fixation protein FixH
MPRRAHIHLPHVPQNPTEGPWLLLKWLIPLFSVVFIINGIMVYKAQKTFSGVTTDHAYEEGLAYNQTLAQKTEQAKLGWNFAIQFKQGNTIYLKATDAAGKPLTGATITAHFQRPATNQQDRNLTLMAMPNDPGTYMVYLLGFERGAWDVTFHVVRPHANGGTDTFDMDTRLDVVSFTR